MKLGWDSGAISDEWRKALFAGVGPVCTRVPGSVIARDDDCPTGIERVEPIKQPLIEVVNVFGIAWRFDAVGMPLVVGGYEVGDENVRSRLLQ